MSQDKSSLNMDHLKIEGVSSTLEENWQLLVAVLALLPTLIVVRTWFKAMGLALQLFGFSREPPYFPLPDI